MKSLDFGRYALCSFTAAVMLTGCGGSQPPIGAPGAMPQTSAIAAHAGRGGSWILPEAKNDDLLYTSDGYEYVYIFSYPQGKLVGELTGFDGPDGLCSDSKGDVFVTTLLNNAVYEYAHGGTEPIAALSDPGDGNGCSIDPTTGNLAVINFGGSLVVYKSASGSPTLYSVPVSGTWYCAYDDSGNVFVSADSPTLYELLSASSTFLDIPVNIKVERDGLIGLQWFKSYLVASNEADAFKAQKIFQIQISGSTGTVVKTTSLYSKTHHDASPQQAVQFWIQGNTIIMPAHRGSLNLDFWNYPSGGDATKTLRLPGDQFWGETVSLAPSR